jgi:Putative membrane protein insertion efficiency factor
MEAVERYGAWRGGVMAIWRLLRCHPLAKGGLDLVTRPTLPQSTRKDEVPAMLFQSYPETRPNQTSANLEMTSY